MTSVSTPDNYTEIIQRELNQQNHPPRAFETVGDFALTANQVTGKHLNPIGHRRNRIQQEVSYTYLHPFWAIEQVI